MKKNLRIVSAAAAALLAVAPVAATSVSTVFADGITVPVEGTAQATPDSKASLNLNVTNVGSLVDGDSPSKVAASISTVSLPSGATIVPAKAQVFEVDSKGTVGSAPITDKLSKDKTYVVQVKVSITGLTNLANKTIKVSNNQLVDKDYDVNGSGIAPDVLLQSAKFSVANTSLQGAPYVTYNDANSKPVVADSGSIDLGTANTVSAVADLIDSTRGKQGKYTATTTAGSAASANAAKASFQNLEQDVSDALKAAGVTIKSDGTFDKPAAPFSINTHLYATNGKTATFSVYVNTQAANGDETFPQMTFNGTTYQGTQSIDSILDAKFNYVPVNGVVDTKAIQDAFKTTVSKADTTTLIPKVDISKVDTKVAGKYPVTVSATNAEGKTTKVTFMLTVGAKGATYKTAQSADGSDIPVYKIEGNTVTDNKTTIKSGNQIAVFGDPIKIGDKSYTRINSADSNLYVETKYVDGSVKPADKTSKTVMHNAYIYDKDHKRVGTNMLRAYTKVDVLGAATKLADGSLVYQIGDNQYVMADNIDGTVRTLSHNAYVYKTSKKRADSRVLRKGAKVTTYGSPYTFKNGKAYYRIGGPSKQYVKVANFN